MLSYFQTATFHHILLKIQFAYYGLTTTWLPCGFDSWPNGVYHGRNTEKILEILGGKSDKF